MSDLRPEIHWDDDNESLVLAGKRYVPELRLLMLREALREIQDYLDLPGSDTSPDLIHYRAPLRRIVREALDNG